MTQRPYLLGLIGGNIMRSLAPTLQEDALRALGLRGHYHLMDLDVAPQRRLEDVFAAVKQVGFAGINVTFPVKQAVMPLLDAISDEARQIGAVNTVTFSDAKGPLATIPIAAGSGAAWRRRSALTRWRTSLSRLSVRAVPVVPALSHSWTWSWPVEVHDIDRAKAHSLAADLARYFGAQRVVCRTTWADHSRRQGSCQCVAGRNGRHPRNSGASRLPLTSTVGCGRHLHAA